MPEWLITALITLGAATIAASGVWIGAILSNRTAAKVATMTAENSLIDQLQEELHTYRNDAGRRATIQDERLNRLETFNDGYRAHIYDLRSHIWDEKEPPPPEWPKDLPR